MLLDLALETVFGSLVSRGSLVVTTAGGKQLRFGDGTDPHAAVRFTDRRAELAFLLDADMRLGELFMDQRFIVEEGTIYDFLDLVLREQAGASPCTSYSSSFHRRMAMCGCTSCPS